MTPRLSVIMAVRNGAEHLEDAVASILGQSFGDFEFVIVDDGSDDATPAILHGKSKSDARVRLIQNKMNSGLTRSLNRALEIARAPIIARMDADDISAPERLARQVAFLEANPDHILVSSSYRAIDGKGRTLYVKRKPADDYCVRWWLRFRMCLEHPATCFRARFPDGTPIRYDESYRVAQDYELFSRLALVGKMAVLPEVLFNYRVHDANITSTRKIEQKTNVLRIATANQRRAFEAGTVEALAPLMQSFMLFAPAERGALRPVVDALTRISDADIARDPGRRHWIRRQTAEVLAHALLRNGGGLRDPGFLVAFCATARHLLPALIMRNLENRNVLPGFLESHPTVG